ncbi:hypothetical protein [Anaerotruncus rubiinfantis]|uniref:hypothetical protein n=1 Tax=Anaerotruncus rubiinfantis TaxID=1720200 RepID=UPI00082F0708|nr:hypothetical protein [Anaerotruncus rubiinfantis]
MDKTSKRVLRFLENQENKFWHFGNGIPDEFEEQTFILAIKFLESREYVEIERTDLGAPRVVRLSHFGVNRKRYKIEDFLRYVRDKWIDFLALIIAISAFIQSCIALYWKQ